MAGADLADAWQVDFIVADLARFTRGEIIALALNVNANLRDQPPVGTPIDTGWASANWVPSVLQPYSDPDITQVKEPSAAMVMARAEVAEQGITTVLSWQPADGPIFSTNNVPYITALNRGHSGQSPRGFVLAAIERAITQTYSRAGAKTARNNRATAARARKPRPKR